MPDVLGVNASSQLVDVNGTPIVAAVVHEECVWVSGPAPCGAKRLDEPNVATSGAGVGEFQFTMSRPYSVGDEMVPWYAVGHVVDAKKSSEPAGRSMPVGLGVGEASHTSARVYGSCPGDGLIEPDTENGPAVAKGDEPPCSVLKGSEIAIVDPGLRECLDGASVG